MITDELLDAIDMLIEICGSPEQTKVMKSVREMLCDFDETNWKNTERPSDCYDWLSQYLSCIPAMVEIDGYGLYTPKL